MSWVRVVFRLVLVAASLVAVALAGTYAYYSRDLPDHAWLQDYEPPVTSRLYAGDGRLLAEYARERRLFVPIQAMPQILIDAVLSAEDKNFLDHPGVDVTSIVGAMVRNIPRLLRGQRMAGASTITQQVAKNMLLTDSYTMDRKVREAILSLRLERSLDKARILELYLNEIYLGHRSHGMAAAALNYFGKSLDRLNPAEAAMVAALPKGPAVYDPVKSPERVRARRDWVLDRMVENGRISAALAAENKARPLGLGMPRAPDVARAEFFAEQVRRELLDRHGEGALYEGGLFVRTTLDPAFQDMAVRALQKGLIAYDRRHGWRGPLVRLAVEGEWQARLAGLRPAVAPESWKVALVLEVGEGLARIGFADGGQGTIPMAEMKWAAPHRPGQTVGKKPESPRDVLAVGDVILVELVRFKPGRVKKGSKPEAYPKDTYGLRQMPDVQGAIVAMDPHTGRVLAMQGGFSGQNSQFNRATQAMRQPGSTIKPFVYLTALERGYLPNSLVSDDLSQLPIRVRETGWRHNGVETLRIGLEKSRNRMTVRLAHELGMDKVAETARRFGINDNMEPLLPMALGAGETTLLRMAAAYSMLVNGGKRITPSFIDRIQDRHGRNLYRRDTRPCDGCRAKASPDSKVPLIADNREAVTDALSAFQMVHMLRGVVLRGTAVRLSRLGLPLAGKTGTTNDYKDGWFIGFSADLVVAAYVGFDQPKTLGRGETGSRTAMPIVRDFSAEASKVKPALPFRVPPEIRFVRMDRHTGERSDGAGTILEAFKPGDRVDEAPSIGLDFAGQKPPEVDPEFGVPRHY